MDAGKNLLITGGMGFIGSNFILQAHRQHSANIINVDLLTDACNPHSLDQLKNDDRYTFIRGDIRNRQLIQEILSTYQPDAVINFAAESHVDRSILHPSGFIHTNIVGTFELLEACKEYGQGRSQFRFLQISTDEVYGSLGIEDLPTTEISPYRPNSPYSAAKASADHLVRSYYQTYGLPTLITTASNTYGARQFPEKLIPLMITNAIARKPLPIYGDGLNIRDWLYVEDHCAAIWLVLKQGRVGETYNIGGNNQLTNLEVVTQICTLLDQVTDKTKDEIDPEFSHKNLITFVKDRLGHDRRYALNCSKINQELGWEPKEPFETGLFKTIQWYRNNPQWIQQVQTVAYQTWINQNYGNLT
ncbi:dTDP-glucose 4,6-dehydratase [Synechococcus sp. PCC 7502]|uniref:dTDP-glucose 4,6-dehydratase n=1 Tax=Synechococcus sp. PCC 7502 TaxID=1173263 RepID=UPI00029FB978|nr:dTDP-glucose 4,6-dehydratase [Synechococcus sp. PCC 7502]AFY74149.1 dTDP-glucose 4,6-dehydratase [Synechococcus sp. PCC 7502]